MTVLSSIALIFGVLGVWLTIKQNILCWPSALVSVVTSAAEFYNLHLFGDMSLQGVYFVAGIYGWVYWNKNTSAAFVVSRTPPKHIPALIIITVLQTALYYYLLVECGGKRPFLDGLLTACSLTVTYMMTKKWVENWLAWVLIDAAYVLLFSLQHSWPFVLLYAVFTAVAFYGWLKWRRTIS